MGGAERLVVDYACGLQRRGHDVAVYTSRHDSTRCFQETCDGKIVPLPGRSVSGGCSPAHVGTLAVTVYGDFLPRHIFTQMHLICAWLRNLYLALCVLLFHRYDVVFCDQVSVAIPLLNLLRPSAPVLFYCHFPDLLLSGARSSLLKRVYRAPLDYVEQRTTDCAHTILVNSEFTRRCFARTFTRIARTPDVLYPSINMPYFDELMRKAARWGEQDTPKRLAHLAGGVAAAATRLLVSVNRFERKKNIELALHTHRLLARQHDDVHLVVAGGYDEAVSENVEYLAELREWVAGNNLRESVTFLPSFSADEHAFLFRHAQCVLYTPSNEHFGIVPLEAMYCRVPVVAVNSGGPLETVVHNKTGLLLEPSAAVWSKRIAATLLRSKRGGGGGSSGVDDDTRERMGEAARRHVVANFGLDAISEQLEVHLQRAVDERRRRRSPMIKRE